MPKVRSTISESAAQWTVKSGTTSKTGGRSYSLKSASGDTKVVWTSPKSVKVIDEAAKKHDRLLQNLAKR